MRQKPTKCCTRCKSTFSKNPDISFKVWDKARYCSLLCFNSTRLGTRLSRIHRQRISNGLKGRIVSDETKKKISTANHGKKRTPETILKLRASHLGLPSPTKGKPVPSRSGSNHWAWKPDRSTLAQNEKKHLDGLYRHWMRAVKNRDKWACRIANTDCTGRLEAHHILRWSKYPALRYEVNNGITLCAFHHPRKINDEERLAPLFAQLALNAK